MTFNEYEGQDYWAQNRWFFLDSDSKVMAKQTTQKWSMCPIVQEWVKWCKIPGWCFGTCFMTFHILGMSSSQLTFIFFRGVGLNHQPAINHHKNPMNFHEFLPKFWCVWYPHKPLHGILLYPTLSLWFGVQTSLQRDDLRLPGLPGRRLHRPRGADCLPQTPGLSRAAAKVGAGDSSGRGYNWWDITIFVANNNVVKTTISHPLITRNR